jgi:hypothetical protein
MTMQDLEIKFNSLSDSLLSESRQKEVKDVIFSCEKMSARELMEILIAK